MKNFIFFVGIIFFAIVIGIMTGASNSPVAGGVLTSLFGIAMAILGLVTNKELEMNSKLSLIGKGFIALSVGLVIGLYCGVNYRYTDQVSVAEKEFIWNKNETPASTYEAIDWMLTNDLLLNRGYTRKQIRDLYKIRLLERNAKKPSETPSWQANEDKYSKETPYYKMIISGYENKLLGRSLASDPNASTEKVY